MNITEFLSTHPLISISGIEKAINITHGTLRKDKIPEKYVQPISDLLSNYGLNTLNKVSALQEQVVEDIPDIVLTNCEKPIEPVQTAEPKKVNPKHPSVWDSMKELRKDK